MEVEELLAREIEFKKLNKQLEHKTVSLMKEIEDVMQKQDIFSNFNKLTLSPLPRSKIKHCCDTPSSSTTSTPERKNVPKKCTTKVQEKLPDDIVNPNVENAPIFHTDNRKLSSQTSTDNAKVNSHSKCNCDCYILSDDRKPNRDMEFLHAFVSVNVKDNILPSSFLKDNLTVESVCKFLSAKAKLMQEQIDKLQITIDKKVKRQITAAKQCDKHMTQLAELESERLNLLNRANSMRAVTADAKAKHLAAQGRLQEKDRLYKEQRSVTDRLTTELKQLKSKNASLEARCASQEETITTLKQQIEAVKMSEKEFRDSSRALSVSNQTAIHSLESKIKALTSRTDKQTALIDNLKKQKALLQTDGALKALEKEYCEFLKQDF